MSVPAPPAVPGVDAPLTEQVAAIVRRLDEAGVGSPQADARWIVEHATGVDPRRPGAPVVAPEHWPTVWALVERRAGREPLQLIVGETAFRTLTVRCAPGVFIPRPETEVVAGLAVAAARAAGPRAVVIEPCTGAGAIACSLAAEVPGARILAGDLDTRAVGLARANGRRLARGEAGPRGLAPGATLEVRHGALLEPMPASLRGRVDVLVANPPYLPAKERRTWEPEVADHDPDRALVAGHDGHEVVDALLEAADEWLAPGGAIILEIDERRGGHARRRASEVGLRQVRLHPDLTGATRALTACHDPGAMR